MLTIFLETDLDDIGITNEAVYLPVTAAINNDTSPLPSPLLNHDPSAQYNISGLICQNNRLTFNLVGHLYI